jgi:hypothetical protein
LFLTFPTILFTAQIFIASSGVAELLPAAVLHDEARAVILDRTRATVTVRQQLCF